MDALKTNPDLFKFKDEKTLFQRGIYIVTGLAIIIVAHVIGTVLKKYIYSIGTQKTPTERPPGEVQISETQSAVQEEKTLVLFVVLGHVVYYAILIIAFMMVFKIVGLETTGLLAILGAAGFAIGLALQGTLSDIAAGILIAIFQIYTIGEIIDYSGKLGKVKDFTMFHTILLDVPSNTTITIPNRKIQEGPIYNLSRQKVFYSIIDVLVSNENKDFTKIINVIKEAVQTNPYVLPNEKTSVFLFDMSSGGTTIRAKIPISTTKLIPAGGALRLAIRNALARNNIAMLDCVIGKEK